MRRAMRVAWALVWASTLAGATVVLRTPLAWVFSDSG